MFGYIPEMLKKIAGVNVNVRTEKQIIQKEHRKRTIYFHLKTG